MPEAFALTREAARRTLGERLYDVQLLGAIVLHQGRIMIESKQGEGTLFTVRLPRERTLSQKRAAKPAVRVAMTEMAEVG